MCLFVIPQTRRHYMLDVFLFPFSRRNFLLDKKVGQGVCPPVPVNIKLFRELSLQPDKVLRILQDR